MVCADSTHTRWILRLAAPPVNYALCVCNPPSVGHKWRIISCGMCVCPTTRGHLHGAATPASWAALCQPGTPTPEPHAKPKLKNPVRNPNPQPLQAAASGKPEAVINKMVEGRLGKFYEDMCLLEQRFFLDDSVKVSGAVNR